MKTRQSKSILSYAVIILSIILFSACCPEDMNTNCWNDNGGAGEPVVPEINCIPPSQMVSVTNRAGNILDLDLMMDIIEDSLANVPGYQVAIAQSGVVVGHRSVGFARKELECQALVCNYCNDFNAASVTKIITGALTHKLLEDNGLDENATIGQWLPTSWNVDAEIQALTFRQLLRHQSGLLSQNTNFVQTLSYNGIQNALLLGVQDSLIGLTRYRNVNYALMRIIIPRLWQVRSDCPADLQNITDINDSMSQLYYEEAVRRLIMVPLGISGYLDVPNVDEETLYYDVSDAGSVGVAPGDWASISGGGGWSFSAGDLVRIMDLIWSGSFFSSAALNNMQGARGFWNSLNAEDGTAFGHGGDIGDGNGYGFHSMLLHFDGSGVSVAVNIDSDLNCCGGWLGNIIRDAYDAALN